MPNPFKGNDESFMVVTHHDLIRFSTAVDAVYSAQQNDSRCSGPASVVFRVKRVQDRYEVTQLSAKELLAAEGHIQKAEHNAKEWRKLTGQI